VGKIVSDTRAKRELSRGYADANSRGLEIALSGLVMGAIGWLLDRWLGTDPFLAIAFGVFGFVGVTAKLWTTYDRDMRRHDEGKPWARREGSAP
jgi:F0F1-type ATP synthase assembly protein I